MKPDFHPNYEEAQIICGCGNKFMSRATKKEIRVEICSLCHPFFTGKQKFVDTAGRIQRFQDKFRWDAQKAVAKK